MHSETRAWRITVLGADGARGVACFTTTSATTKVAARNQHPPKFSAGRGERHLEACGSEGANGSAGTFKPKGGANRTTAEAGTPGTA